jgi:hypothetical protein
MQLQELIPECRCMIPQQSKCFTLDQAPNLILLAEFKKDLNQQLGDGIRRFIVSNDGLTVTVLCVSCKLKQK